MSRISLGGSHKNDSQKEDSSGMTFPSQPESRMIIEEKVPPKVSRGNSFSKDKILEDEGDELEIPAFIRRKMGK